MSKSDLTPADVQDISRTVGETTIGPGESTTVTVTVDLTEPLQLEPGDLVEIEDSFSPGFEAVTHQEGTPEPGGAGGSADGEEYLAVWNEGADSYTVTYEVTVPLDATGDQQFNITGTVDLAGQEESLPDETIDVGISDETDVALVASDSTVPGEEMVPLELVVTGADAGIGSYSVELTTDDTTAVAFADIDLTNPAETDNSQITNGGASALVDAELSQNHPAEPATVIAELTLDTGEEGEATLSVDSASVADQNGDSYQIASQTGVTLTVQTGPPALPGFDSEPQDLNDDGLYRDVDGDGQFDIFDVQAFFETFESAEVQNNVDAFDFNGDGEVDIADVQALFDQLGEN